MAEDMATKHCGVKVVASRENERNAQVTPKNNQVSPPRCQISLGEESEENAGFGLEELREARGGYERREEVGGAIERSYFPGSFFSVSASTSGSSVNSGSSSCNCSFSSCCCGNVFDVHSNAYGTHPVDVLAKVVEAEGIRQLLIMMKKKDLLFLSEQSSTEILDKENKRQLIKTLAEAWLLRGTKKFLKTVPGDAHLVLICKRLGLPFSPDRKASIELLLRQINVLGLEVFAKRLRDEQVKGFFIGQVHDQTQQIQKIAADAPVSPRHRKGKEERAARAARRKNASPEGVSRSPSKDSLSGSVEIKKGSLKPEGKDSRRRS